MSELSLHKTEKLCSRTAVNRLFAEGKPAKAYPLRAVYNESNRTYLSLIHISEPTRPY